MLNALLDLLVGCWHRKTSFPLTARSDAGTVQTYVVCLDCGRQFSYDWTRMRTGESLRKTQDCLGLANDAPSGYAASASASVSNSQ